LRHNAAGTVNEALDLADSLFSGEICGSASGRLGTPRRIAAKAESMSPSGPACQSGMDADDGIEVGVSRAHYCRRGDRGPSGGRMHRFYTGPRTAYQQKRERVAVGLL
jgi:hypothetical protein